MDSFKLMAKQMRPEPFGSYDLHALAKEVNAQIIGYPIDQKVTGITLDSRLVLPGDIFCGLPGAKMHGAEFSAQVKSAGAVAILTDSVGAKLAAAADLPALVCEYPRRMMAHLSAMIYGQPQRRLKTVAVTGTNGKTSVTTMLVNTLRVLDQRCGVIGTNGTFYDSADGLTQIKTQRTTPESCDLYAMLARFVQARNDFAAMEVSSHALVLDRVEGLVFDQACFMNLSQDHLDFHRDMEDYFAAKALLFTPEHARQALVCLDDEWGQRLAMQTTLPKTTFATLHRNADWWVENIEPGRVGYRFELVSATERYQLQSFIPGRHYIANTVAVVLLLRQAGFSFAEVAAALAQASGVPGRMEVVAESPLRVIVDYAHTEGALIAGLSALDELKGGHRVWCIMGAGGDRDRSKRPQMGKAAARLADEVVVTDDNPRSEDPSQIRAEVIGELNSADHVQEIPSRRDAIAWVLANAAEGDLVFIAGKGAETGQDIGGVIHPFDDRKVARECLNQRFKEQKEGQD